MRATVNIYDAKTNLSRLINRVRDGDEIIIARAGVPVAKLVPYSRGKGVREPGLFKQFKSRIDDSDQPLPDEAIRDFYD